MTKDIVLGQFGIGDLAHQLRLDPVDAAGPLTRHSLERVRLAGKFRQLLVELVQEVLRKAGADTAAIEQLALFPGAQQQRGKAATLGRGRPTADDKLLALDAFDLEPAARAIASIGRIGLLGDDALIAVAAERIEYFLAMAAHMGRVLHRILAGGFAEK